MSVHEPGRMLGGRYGLQHEIARGGMATVWAAHDTLLERDVAIKLLHPQFATDAEFLERFRRESRSAARLSHPNIVPIYDVGEDAATRSPFIVMELVDGGNLKDLIRRTPKLPDAEIRSMGATLAAALDYAHGRGIIHRDVKPQNVLLGSDGRPRLTDFGIAQALTASGLTRTGAVMGSVQYIAPELVRGRPASAQSDVYALGAVLYELATGRVPFEGETDLAVALAHVEETPAAPRAFNARLSPELEATILRALAKAPEQRFATGAELATALRNGVPSRAAVESATERIPTVAAASATVAAPPRRARTVAAAAPQAARRATRPRGPRGASGGVLALLLAMAAVLAALGAGFFGLATLSREGLAPPQPTPARSAPTPAPKPAGVPPTETPAPVVAPTATIEPSPTPSPVPPSPTPPPAPTATPRSIPVPQLRGKTLDQAQTALKADGLTSTVRGVNQNVDKDVVADQSPDVGTSLPPGGTVTIVVGTGSTVIPNVAGQIRDQATRTLQTNSFHVVVRTRRDPRVPEGYAIETRPPAGTVAARNSEVELTISQGR